MLTLFHLQGKVGKGGGYYISVQNVISFSLVQASQDNLLFPDHAEMNLSSTL